MNIRMDADLKKQFEAFCSEIGMTMTTAVCVFAKMAAKLQTAMKMAVNDDQSQAAKLLTEGCNMGIETISGSLNEYRDADSKSVAIAERLRTLEEKMVGDLQPLL